MAIEEMFAKVKAILKANDKVYTTILMSSLWKLHIQIDCLHYIQHAGYL